MIGKENWDIALRNTAAASVKNNQALIKSSSQPCLELCEAVFTGSAVLKGEC